MSLCDKGHLTQQHVTYFNAILYMTQEVYKEVESQCTWHIAVIEAKEQRRKQCEAKENRTSTGRTKVVEALAQTSQLLNSIEFPFHSS